MMLLLINGAPSRRQPHTSLFWDGRRRAMRQYVAEAGVPRRHHHVCAIGVNATAAIGTAFRRIVDFDADVG
jgi:hypothetical protein